MDSNEIKPWGSLNWPNRISILRLVMIGPFIIMLLNQDQWPWARYAGLAVFVTMSVSDIIDGMLARRLNAKTRLGAILVPLADKALILSSAVLLALPASAVPEAKLPNWVVVAIVGKDLWVIVGFMVVYLVTDRFRIVPTQFGKICTTGQLVMVGCVLIAPDINRLRDGLGGQVATALSFAVAVLCALAVISYTRLGLRFVAQEQKPLENHREKEQPK